MRSEGYFSENVTWSTFVSACSENMRLREGCIPELAWKFNGGPGCKEWTTLSDEGSYHRMMEAAAKRIRSRAKKEANLKDADLGSGWRIDLKVLNNVQRVEEPEDDEDEMVSTKGKEKKKKSKGKAPKRRKRGEHKKVFSP